MTPPEHSLKGTNMTTEELRLECLKLALGHVGPADALKLANDYAVFAITGDAGQSPRAKINAALDAANVK